MNQKNPLVSVCIPIYNGESYLEETVRALLQQSYQNLEIIVVDDGSTDRTAIVAQRVAHPRFTFLQQESRGAAAARNRAYKEAKGDLIKFMDADDIVNEACIGSQVARLAGHPYCIASAKWGRFYNNDLATFRYSPEPVWKDMKAADWLVASLLESGGNMMQPGIFLLPRDLLETTGLWNEELSLIDDFEFMCRVLTNADKVLFCPEAVLKYRSGNSGSLSGKKKKEHMQSAYRSLDLGLTQILRVANTDRAKQAAANAFQRWAYQFYPEHPELFSLAEQKAKALGGATVKPEGGRKFKWLSKLLGWKLAKKWARPA